MQIPIKIGDKQFFIISDLNQYMIAEERARAGEIRIEGRWFYQSLAALCTALLHKKVRASDALTLEKLRDAVLLSETEIMQAFDFSRRGKVIAEKVESKLAL